jgi:Flp pilus assembly protein CpaB
MSTTATKTGHLPSPGAPADRARPGTVRPPSPTKHRRSGLIGLAVLLIVGSAAVAGLLAVRLDSRSAVLVAGRDIAIGQQISRADLREARVASEGLSLIPVAQSGQVLGKYAAQAIPLGRLLDAKMLQTKGYLKRGVVAVGVSVPSGRMPANGLQQGDRVQIIQVTDGTAKVLVDSAVVSTPPAAARSDGSGGLLPGGSSQGPGAVATVIVSPQDAPDVAAASAANQLSLVLVERGSQLGD